MGRTSGGTHGKGRWTLPTCQRNGRALLDQRVTDGVIRRTIEDGLLHFAAAGTPQGGVIPPILSNIFLHHVVDRWFEEEVRPRSGRRPWCGLTMTS